MSSKVINISGLNIHADLLYWESPKTISIELTNRCNLMCKHCFRRKFSFSQGNIELDMAYNLISNASKLGIKELNISGSGESLLYDRLSDIINMLDRFDFNVSTTTNGTLLIKRKHYLKKFHFVYVSLDAIDGQIHFDRRGLDSKHIIRNIVKFRKKFPNVGIGFITVLNRNNVWELEKIVRFAGDIGASSVYVYHQIFYDYDDFKKLSLFFDKESYKLSLMKSINLARKLGVQLVHPATFDKEIPAHSALSNYVEITSSGSFKCNWIFTSLGVTWNGYYQACCFVDRLLMGKANKEDIQDVWNGPAYRKIRLEFLNGRIPPECRNCLFLQSVCPERYESYVCPHFEDKFFNDKALLYPDVSVNFKEINDLYQEGIRKLLARELSSAANIFDFIVSEEPLFFEASNSLAVSLFLAGKKELAISVMRKAKFLDDTMKSNLKEMEKV